MNKIIVIGTTHTEQGLCTSDELTKIIDDISPSVIFCEAAPEVFDRMLKATDACNTPEIKVLRKIIHKGIIEVIPIDINEDPFDRRLEAMFELIKKQFKEYLYASEIQTNEAFHLGFAYLNSVDSDQIHRDKIAMEKYFIKRVKNGQLSKTHIDWLEWNNKRENLWINEIHDYLENNKTSNALFLVGSAHRVGLMKKVENLLNSNELIPNWDFYHFR